MISTSDHGITVIIISKSDPGINYNPGVGERRPTYPLDRLRLYAGFTEVSGAVDVDTGYSEAVLLA